MAYGYCPECGFPGADRERSPDGDTMCGMGHKMKSVEWDRLQKLDGVDARPDLDARQNRIEALRAASRLMAPIVTEKTARYWQSEDVLTIAEQFAKWLETGGRE